MTKLLIKTFLGIILTTAGMFCCYLFLQSLSTGANLLYLGLIVLLLSTGVFVLVNASKSYQWVSTIDTAPTIDEPVQKRKSIIEQNTEIAHDWARTNEVRDRLKLLKAEGAAEEGA